MIPESYRHLATNMMRLLFVSMAAVLLGAAGAAAQVGKGGGNKFGWYSDYKVALAEAKRTGKPIFLVFRCEPCVDCAQIDEQVVRLNQEIADTADKFVRVRLVRIAGADLRLFEFDHDVTWFAFFLNADEQIYGRYGGRDATDAQARISLKGLRYALEQALAAHKNPAKPVPRTEKPLRAEDFAAAKRHSGCIHCHNVNEFRRADLKSQGLWTREDSWVYPMPENIGLCLDVDAGNQVKTVVAGTPSDKAGIKVGDLIEKINGIPVASFADASYGLHKAPSKGQIPILWRHDGKQMSAVLDVAEGWRKTNLGWRPSLLDILPLMPLSGDDLKPEEKKQLGLPVQQLAFRQDKFVHSSLKAIGLQKDDIVVGVDGKQMDGTLESFLAYIRSNYLVGDRATLNVLRAGKKVELAITLK
jgi:serine protease Do